MNLKEPTTLKVRLHQVELERGVSPVKVMLTGDWHISPIISERQLKFLKEALEQARPDVIILQGDMVDSPLELERDTSLKKLVRELKLCAKYAPTALVLGSHDFITPTKPKKIMKEFAIPRWKILCKKCGVRLLMDEWMELEQIRIFGAFQDEKCSTPDDEDLRTRHHDNPAQFEKFIDKFDFSKLSDDKVNWFAAHAPLLTPRALAKCQGFDVMSFGHTHGGMVPRGMDEIFEKLGIHGGLISANKGLFPRKVRGMWTENGTAIVINAGMTGAQFCAPKLLQDMNAVKAAEVTLVEVDGK